jgi:hypothetical protein
MLIIVTSLGALGKRQPISTHVVLFSVIGNPTSNLSVFLIRTRTGLLAALIIRRIIERRKGYIPI